MPTDSGTVKVECQTATACVLEPTRRQGTDGGSVVSFGIPDVARLARSTGAAARMAQREAVTPTAARAIQQLTNRHARYVDELANRLRRASEERQIGDPTAAIAALEQANSSLRKAHGSLKATVTTTPRFERMPFLGARSDARGGVEALKEAARDLERAATAVDEIPGTTRISAANSPYLLDPAEIARMRETPHTPTPLEELTPGTRELLAFDDTRQTRIARVYRHTVGRLFDTRWHDAQKLDSAHHPTLGTLYLGSHMRIVDPPELLAGLRAHGVEGLRALGNDGVVKDFPFLKRAGLYGISNRVGDEVVEAMDLNPVLLDQGQSVMMFQDGTLVPLIDGAVGEPRRGAAIALTRTGAPMQLTASYGLQSKLDIGSLARGRQPQTVVGDQMWVRKAAPGSDVDEQVRHVTELIAQEFERLQQRAFRAYVDQ